MLKLKKLRFHFFKLLEALTLTIKPKKRLNLKIINIFGFRVINLVYRMIDFHDFFKIKLNLNVNSMLLGSLRYFRIQFMK